MRGEDMRRFSLVLIALIAVGCGGDDDGGVMFDARRIDMALPPDAGGCVASADYGTIMPMGMEQTAGEDEIGPDGGTRPYYFWLGIIGNGTPNVSILEIDLWPGDGVFAGGPVVTGNVPLMGEELDQMSCGVCVYLLSDLTIDSMMRITAFDEVYFATGGSVNLTSVPVPPTADASPTAPDGSGGATGMIAGSVMSVQLGQLNRQTFDPIVGGCTSQVAGGNFGASLIKVPLNKLPKRGVPLASEGDILQLLRGHY
jgi:hypothetical protein